MIKARLSDGTFIFGIDLENVRRLMSGMPLKVDMRPLGGSDKFFMMYGETLEDVKKELEKASGRALPPQTIIEDGS